MGQSPHSSTLSCEGVRHSDGHLSCNFGAGLHQMQLHCTLENLDKYASDFDKSKIHLQRLHVNCEEEGNNSSVGSMMQSLTSDVLYVVMQVVCID